MPSSLSPAPLTRCVEQAVTIQRGDCAPPALGRRNFLKATARAVLLVEASGLPWGELFTPAARAADAGIVRVTLADFPALASVDGSIFLNVADPQFQDFPVILTRTGTQTYVAVSSICTHSGCPVQPYSAANGGLLCPCHGSLYTPQGAVLRGPAGFALTGYPTRLVSAAVLEVEIPGIGYALAGALVNTAAGQRMRLSFPTVNGLRYEVKRRTTMTTPAATVPFSLTETGAATATQLTGNGATATLYVEAGATGFLSVARST